MRIDTIVARTPIWFISLFYFFSFFFLRLSMIQAKYFCTQNGIQI